MKNVSQVSADELRELEFDRIVDEVTQKIQAGEEVDVGQYAMKDPSYAERLWKLLPALKLLADIGTLHSDEANDELDSHIQSLEKSAALEGELGDFRIVREVGRGGMGVVYEAEQISLGRRVALKVLPFAGMLDTRQLQRFKNEARAAAGLHHSNIVPVYSVGCERGVHFFAMQFIDGQTLADLILQLRRDRSGSENNKKDKSKNQSKTKSDSTAPQSALTETFDFRPPLTQSSSGAAQDTAHTALVSTHPSGNDRAYFDTVARIGMQIADALEYAHSLGVIHRDIKPSNLILDGFGTVWVTDFGLAQMESDAGLTMSGDLLGTLRYMSPEQARSEHRNVDGRSDIYSLGVTLYELITLEPAFPSRDRRELLLQVAAEDPSAPRKLVPGLPCDLETILLKCMNKDPRARYVAARELADDLRRYLADEPIKARRPALRERAARWVRRHPALVAGLSTAAVISMCLVTTAAFWVARKTQRTADARVQFNQQIADVLAQLDRQRTQAQAAHLDDPALWLSVQELGQRAHMLSQNQLADPKLTRHVRQKIAEIGAEQQDRKLLARIDQGLDQSTNVDLVRNEFQNLTTADNTLAALREWGIAAELTSPQQAADRIKSRPASVQLSIISTLESLSSLSRKNTGAETNAADHAASQKWMRDVVELVDAGSDPAHEWRSQYRRALRESNKEQLLSLAKTIDQSDQPSSYWLNMASQLETFLARPDESIELLRRAQIRFPSDFFINAYLAQLLRHREPQEMLRYSAVAVALRPDNPGANFNAALALLDLDRRDEAMEILEKVVSEHPDYGAAHSVLGDELRKKGDLSRAEAELRKALEIHPDAITLNYLALLLLQKNDIPAAIAEFRRALEFDPRDESVLHNLSIIYLQLNDGVNAEWALRKLLELQPNNAEAHNNLGTILMGRAGNEAEGLAEFRQAAELLPDNFDFRRNLALALIGQGDGASAAVEFEKALALVPDRADLHREFAWILATHPDAAGLVQSQSLQFARQAIGIDKSRAAAWNTLGLCLYRAGQWQEAREAVEQSISLNQGGDALDWLLMAMCHKRLGDDVVAADYYQRAVQWMAEHPDVAPKLAQFQQEAAGVLHASVPPAEQNPQISN